MGSLARSQIPLAAGNLFKDFIRWYVAGHAAALQCTVSICMDYLVSIEEYFLLEKGFALEIHNLCINLNLLRVWLLVTLAVKFVGRDGLNIKIELAG